MTQKAVHNKYSKSTFKNLSVNCISNYNVMIKTALIALLSLASLNGFAQSATEKQDEKIYDHYIGAQVGQLLMHLFNSNANSIGTGNPYLVTYSMNSRKSGWGVRFGAGYNTTSNSTALSSSTATTDNNDIQFRAGVEKTYELSDKWTAGTGFDLVMNSQNDRSVASNYNYQYDTITTTTNYRVFTLGGGVFGKVNYHLGKKVLIGTEASMYYLAGTKEQTTDVVTAYVNNPTTATGTKSRPSIHQGNFNLPIVVYLILKF